MFVSHHFNQIVQYRSKILKSHHPHVSFILIDKLRKSPKHITGISFELSIYHLLKLNAY